MEEESLPVSGEDTTTPSASENESTPEVEISEADTSDQPTEEVTPEKPSRAQERISKLASERNYWKDLAQQNQTPTQTDDDTPVTVDEIARRTAQIVREESKQERATELLLHDGVMASEKYPELDTDEDLASDVLALAQGRGISLVAAADKIIGRKQREVAKLNEAKFQANSQIKAGGSTGTSKKVSTGEPAKVNFNSMTEEEKAANWSEIVNQYAE